MFFLVISNKMLNFAVSKTIKHITIMTNKTRYVLVVFCDGIGCTYQTNNKVKWFFTHSAVSYQKLACAKKKAEVLGRKYPNCKVCVFKVELEERLSCDQYKKWCKDDSRLMFEFLYNN